MQILASRRQRHASGHRYLRCRSLVLLAVILLAAGGAAWAGVTATPASTSATSATAKPVVAAEYQIKAVFLFNFTKYVDWPASAFADAQAPFVIGILGDDPFGSALDDTVRGEKVDGRPLVIQRYSSWQDIKDCQILYISQSKSAELARIFAGIKGRSILTVGDADNFTDQGGMIWLVTENSKIRLKINLDPVKAANLTISSSLLRAAEVTGRPKE